MTTELNALYTQVLAVAENIPFGNSDWQNRHAIVNEELTPYRALRHSLLRIMNRFEALRHARYELRKRDIEVRQLQRALSKSSDPLERELIELEIEHKLETDAYTKKLIYDAVREIESLWPVIESVGVVSREEFERQEAEHFQRKCNLTSSSNDLYREITGLSLGAELPRLLDELLLTNG